MENEAKLPQVLVLPIASDELSSHSVLEAWSVTPVIRSPLEEHHVPIFIGPERIIRPLDLIPVDEGGESVAPAQRIYRPTTIFKKALE